MRSFAFLLAVLGVSTFAAGEDLPTKGQIERDLKLKAELPGPKVLHAGMRPRLTLRLVNDSRTASHCLVRPGDGSEVGWREPHVYWTATVDREGADVRNVSPLQGWRCKFFAWDWPRDVCVLKPGEQIELDSFQPLLEFQQAGRVTLRAHFAYRQGKGELDRSDVSPERFGEMAGIPAFELVSDAIEFDVVRPLEVRVRPKRSVRKGVEQRLSDVMEVLLVNQSSEAIQCSSPTLTADARLVVETDGQQHVAMPTLSTQHSTYGVKRSLLPGESVSLLGDGEFANGIDGTWQCRSVGKVRMRAVYITRTWKRGAAIKSDWVEIDVKE